MTAPRILIAPSGQGVLFLFSDPITSAVANVTAVSADPTQFPAISVNGGQPIRLASPYWGEGLHNSDGSTRSKSPYLPWVYFPLPQSAPAARYESVGTHLNTTTGSWPRTQYDHPAVGSGKTGYSKLTKVANGTTQTAVFPQVPLPPGTYRVSATWPSDPGFSADVTYTVTDRAGATLATHHANQSAPPTGATDGGVAWEVLGTFTITGYSGDLTVTQRNAAGGWMVADTIRWERTSPDVSVKILATDTVTVTAPAGWAATASGAAPAMNGAAAENHVGGHLYPDLPTAPTMGIGFNVPVANYYTGMALYANFARLAAGGTALAYDADGYPTKISYGNTTYILVAAPYTNQADGRKIPIGIPGPWTVTWDGKSLPSFSGGVEDLTQKVITGGVGNKRVFTLAGNDEKYGPDVSLVIAASVNNGDGTYQVDCRNIRVTPPGVDPANPPRWMPQVTAACRGVKGLRFLDPIGGNSGNATVFEDYEQPQSRFTRGGKYRTVVATVVRVEGLPGTPVFDPNKGANILFTTAAPHGYASGQVIQSFGNIGTATFSDGKARSLNGSLGSAEMLIRVTSPTAFLIQIGSAAGGARTAVTMTNVLTPAGGTATMAAGNGMPVSDMVDLCNTVGADFYFNMSMCASDDCLDRVGRLIGGSLNPGLNLRAECANETWNPRLGSNNYWFQMETYARGLGSSFDYVPSYCETAARQWQAFKAGFVAGGGDPARFVRVLASQHTAPGTTTNLVNYCRSRSIGFDELATGPYWANNATPITYGRTLGEPWAMAIVDLLTPGQVLDFFEGFWTWGGHEKAVQAHRQKLDAAGYRDVKIIAYEGGPDFVIPTPSNNARVGERTHAVTRHPRFYGIYQHCLRVFQDSGMSTFHDYVLAGGDGGSGFVAWPVYLGTAMPPGTGDPAQDAGSIANPDDLTTAKSQVGGAILRWASLVSGGGGGGGGSIMDRIISRINALRKLRRH